jgi:hypothetical protein
LLASLGGLTVPLILITFVGALTAFEVKVMLLVKAPVLSVAYFTPITADSPGAIGPFGTVGTVHPHEPLASVITRGELPVFVK